MEATHPFFQVGHIGCVRKEHDKLVAHQPRGNRIVAHKRFQPAGNRLQQLVADDMAAHVVDMFELGDVENHQTDEPFLLSSPLAAATTNSPK